MKVTDKLIESGKSAAGGWTKKQLELIGVTWPPIPGWADRAIGREIRESDALLFTALKNSAGSSSNYKPTRPKLTEEQFQAFLRGFDQADQELSSNSKPTPPEQ